MRKRIAVIVISCLLFGLAGCDRGQESASRRTTGFDVTSSGVKLPDFILPQAADAGMISAAELANRVVMISFVTSWCVSCRQEMLLMEEVSKVFPKEDFTPLAVVLGQDDPDKMKIILAKLDITYPVILDDHSLARAFGGIVTVPVTFLIDRKGLVRKKFITRMPKEELIRDIKALLAES